MTTISTKASKLSGYNSFSEVYDNAASIVRRDPKSIDARVLLFQFFCINGDWDKALNQLLIINDLSDDYKDFVRTYDLLIRCERMRQLVLSGERKPLIIGEPDEWIAFLVQALSFDAEKNVVEATKLRDLAFELAPTKSFVVNDDVHVDWLADSDSRYGPILEICLNGKYYWVPFNRIEELKIEVPTDLRDLVWLPVTISIVAGAEEVGFIPVRYVKTETENDEQFKLARKTEWVEIGNNYFSGVGQRIFSAGEVDFPLLDIRSLQAMHYRDSNG